MTKSNTGIEWGAKHFWGEWMEEAFAFYTGTLRALCDEGLISTLDAVLAVAAGEFDRKVLTAAGFSDVVISNMDTRMDANSAAFAPYRWAFEDAERLGYADRSFDFAVVHSGLHHCRVPHQALAEMYRVARKGVLFIESRDSLLMKAAARAGLLAEYEIEAVVGNDYQFGGQRNSATPNYVYRWTEREVEKTANSIDPTGKLTFRYFYAFRLPTERLSMHRSATVRAMGAALSLPASLAAKVLRRQGNLFGAFIGRPRAVWPWINDEGTIRRDWAEQRFAARTDSRQR